MVGGVLVQVGFFGDQTGVERVRRTGEAVHAALQILQTLADLIAFHDADAVLPAQVFTCLCHAGHDRFGDRRRCGSNIHHVDIIKVGRPVLPIQARRLIRPQAHMLRLVDVRRRQQQNSPNSKIPIVQLDRISRCVPYFIGCCLADSGWPVRATICCSRAAALSTPKTTATGVLTSPSRPAASPPSSPRSPPPPPAKSSTSTACWSRRA